MANGKITNQYTPPPATCTLGGGIDYSRIPGPVDQPMSTPEAFAKGKTTISMYFPKYVHLNLGPTGQIDYTPGIHDVPIEIADNWYLKAAGATPYIAPETPTAA